MKVFCINRERQRRTPARVRSQVRLRGAETVQTDLPANDLKPERHPPVMFSGRELFEAGTSGRKGVCTGTVSTATRTRRANKVWPA
ncbi:hypothetical protein BIW11_04174 [Tropilaelaps mercedesae]|uniref:Uncharacterized protein n=1 Tax=Tropilaelaps mercedesae TaxID=418985 RepID=A0A1V9XAI7_9ACAR|nr:hypothetical protein BIW11_04174 [Tropilaelaps mercedesae]